MEARDPNVQAIIEYMKERAEFGYKKYGTTTARTDLSHEQWLQHLQDELLDGAVYIERLKQEFK